MFDFRQTNKQNKQTKYVVHTQYCILSFFLQKNNYENGVVSMKKEGEKK
jgi:hypothetical protein